jgi:hypothetical protein
METQETRKYTTEGHRILKDDPFVSNIRETESSTLRIPDRTLAGVNDLGFIGIDSRLART